MVDPEWMQHQLQLLNNSEYVRIKQPPSYACLECRRKKTKCDMKKPCCSLCSRVDLACVYPTSRKVTGARRKMRRVETEQANSQNEQLSSNEFGSGKNSGEPSFPTQIPLSSPVTAMSDHLDEVCDVSDHDAQRQHQQQPPQSSQTLEDNEMPFMLDAPNFWQNPFMPELIESGQVQDVDLNHGEIASFEMVGSLPTYYPHLPSESPTGIQGEQVSMDDFVPLQKLECSAPVADHLIELFFLRVQGVLPLLHRPKIYAEFLKPQGDRERSYDEITVESAILLNSMFALSARFSECDHFWNVPPKERGLPFARKAKALWRHYVTDDEEPTLRMLQNQILLTFYELTSKPSFLAWQSTGICCRMAYSLSLHQIDRDSVSKNDSQDHTESDWVEQEERRRAWWACFQLDNVASAIACRPFNIDSSNMDVLLPVSDHNWYVGQRTPSALLSPKGPSEAWRSLQNCPNQEVYAWFLVCNELLRSAHNIFARRHRAVEEIKVLHSALHCFALALPRDFRLTASNMTFEDHNYTEKNWVICTIILLQASQIYSALALEIENMRTGRSKANSQDYSPFSAVCSPYINDELCVLRLWSPNYVEFASPLVACALLGPAAIHATERPSRSQSVGGETMNFLEGQILSSVLKRFSYYWPLASIVDELLEYIKTTSDQVVSLQKKAETTWVKGLMPVILKDAI